MKDRRVRGLQNSVKTEQFRTKYHNVITVGSVGNSGGWPSPSPSTSPKQNLSIFVYSTRFVVLLPVATRSPVPAATLFSLWHDGDKNLTMCVMFCTFYLHRPSLRLYATAARYSLVSLLGIPS